MVRDGTRFERRDESRREARDYSVGISFLLPRILPSTLPKSIGTISKNSVQNSRLHRKHYSSPQKPVAGYPFLCASIS